MASTHGGKRPGSGRKAKPATEAPVPVAPTRYDDALAYLEAVVRGDEPADGLRIAAAKVVLPFQSPKRRAPVESPAPRALRAATERAGHVADADAWEVKAAEVRRRLGRENLQ